MSKPGFSIVAEKAAGERAAQEWLELNPDYCISPEDTRSAPFEDYTLDRLRECLGLSKREWREWWRRWGSDQEPSNSFTRGFISTLAKNAPLAPVATTDDTTEPG